MSFSKAMTKLRKSEGGYVNDPDDIGGETYAGISRKFFPRWEGWRRIDLIKKVRKIKLNEKILVLNIYIDEFYAKYFWYPLKCHRFNNPLIADHLFDCGVNLGKRSAVRFFQRTFNSYQISRGRKFRLVVDGLIGPITIGNIEHTPKAFINYLVESRIQLYFNKCKAKPVKYKYLRGWCMRSLRYLKK